MKHAQFAEDVSVVVAQSIAELSPFLADLEELASAAAEPNVFYEPWMLVPAMRWLARGADLHLSLFFIRGKGSTPRGQLCGFFPLEVLSRYNHFPVKTARLWRHKFCYLCTPLLRQGRERETLAAFFEWSASHSTNWRLVEFGLNSGAGVLHELLVDSTASNQRVNLVDVRFTRPFLQRALTADTYLRTTVSPKHRKDIGKKERKLRQLGKVEYATPIVAEEAGEWIDEFVELEASGWKGRGGATISADPAHRSFFREAMNAAWRAGRLDLIGLRLNSKLIALKINLLCRGGSFAFMITFDERYAAYSPGLLLEVENIRRLHKDSDVEWMDSCADQHSPMFNRIWSEKRVIETLLVSNDSWVGDAWIGLIPLGHWLRRTFLGFASGRNTAVANAVRRPEASPREVISLRYAADTAEVCVQDGSSEK
ncbi:MAG: GNAT family N-acetyltransferase [Terriglobales bacterium]